MSKFIVFFVISFLMLTVVSKAEEKFPKTYVDSTEKGDDKNPCNKPNQSCHTITEALKKTKDGGTIILLEAGNYESNNKNCQNIYDRVVDISQSVTIEAARGLKSKPCFYFPENDGQGDHAISIKSDAPIKVKLKGLLFVSPGNVGVYFWKGSELKVQNCQFERLNHAIIFIGAGFLSVKNSTINATTGIWIKKNGNLTYILIKNNNFVGVETAMQFDQIKSAEVENNEINK